MKFNRSVSNDLLFTRNVFRPRHRYTHDNVARYVAWVYLVSFPSTMPEHGAYDSNLSIGRFADTFTHQT